MKRTFQFDTRLLFVVGMFVVLLLSGTIGYMWIEDWGLHDAFFMTVITLSTVGYGEVRPLTQLGEGFTIVLILLGVGGVAYTFSTLADYIVAGELNGFLRRQRMMRDISKLRRHYIICGYGRVGQQVAQGLRANKYDVVVIDAVEDHVAEFEAQGIFYVIGDAASDPVLQQAGIEHASGLCTCLPSDATNVFVVLSARTFNPELFIISRSNLPESERKLRIAGANQVINPYTITGHRMAAQLLHPSVVEFLDVIMRAGELELRIEEIKVGEKSTMNGRSLADCNVRGDTGVNVLAIRRHNGQLYTHLPAAFVLNTGDTLIGLGTQPQLSLLAQRAADERHALHVQAPHGV
ncbi:MAG TPA: NAD-binding protein [Caldilineaceae bacterium]|nr:NAD-binding protein [Caldilineaceae bacterium]